VCGKRRVFIVVSTFVGEMGGGTSARWEVGQVRDGRWDKCEMGGGTSARWEVGQVGSDIGRAIRYWTYLSNRLCLVAART